MITEFEADLARFFAPAPPPRGWVRWRKLWSQPALQFAWFARRQLRAESTGHRHRARLWHLINLRFTGGELGPSAVVGPGLLAPHPLGLVIGAGTRIGANCTIHPHVVFGQRRPGEPGQGFPAIGDGCAIGANAVLLGAITLGDRVTVAAGAVVLDDVPDGCLVVGVPARIVSDRAG